MTREINANGVYAVFITIVKHGITQNLVEHFSLNLGVLCCFEINEAAIQDGVSVCSPDITASVKSRVQYGMTRQHMTVFFIE